MAQTPLSHIIFWKSVMRTFRCIHVNCFNRLRFLAEVRTKLQNCTFLDNLKTTTQEGNMDTRQITPFFSSFFFRCNCLKHSFKYLKIVKIHFHVVPPLVYSFWSSEGSQKKVSSHSLPTIPWFCKKSVL